MTTNNVARSNLAAFQTMTRALRFRVRNRPRRSQTRPRRRTKTILAVLRSETQCCHMRDLGVEPQCSSSPAFPGKRLIPETLRLFRSTDESPASRQHAAQGGAPRRHSRFKAGVPNLPAALVLAITYPISNNPHSGWKQPALCRGMWGYPPRSVGDSRQESRADKKREG